MNARLVTGGLVVVFAATAGFVGFVEGQRKGRRDAWIAAEEEMDALEDRLKRLYKIGEYSTPFFLEGTTPPEAVIPRKSGEASIKNEEASEFAATLDPEQMQNLRDHIEAQGYATMSQVSTEETENIFAGSYENEDSMVETTPNMDDPSPYVITEDVFAHDEESYGKISLSYYPIDRVVADEMDRVVDDVESSIGFNNLNALSLEAPVLHVRNDRLEADFEIALEVGSYRETVLGEAEPVEEQRRGRKGRSTQDE